MSEAQSKTISTEPISTIGRYAANSAMRFDFVEAPLFFCTAKGCAFGSEGQRPPNPYPSAFGGAKKEIFPLVVEHSKKINQFFALQKGAAFFWKSMHSKAHENRKMFNYFHNCMYYYNIFCYSAGIFYDMLQICFCSVEKKELFLQFTDIFLVTFFFHFSQIGGTTSRAFKAIPRVTFIR